VSSYIAPLLVPKSPPLPDASPSLTSATFTSTVSKEPTFQDIQGIKHATPYRPCGVVCQGWPSWLTITGAISLCCTDIFIDQLSIETQQRISKQYPSLQWHPLDLQLALLLSGAFSVLLIQGSTGLLNSCTQLPWQSPQVLYCGCLDSRPGPTSSFCGISWHITYVGALLMVFGLSPPVLIVTGNRHPLYYAPCST